MASARVIIVGGGFGGVKCAKTLRKKLSPEACEIVLFNRENHMVFHPLLAEVVGASINANAIAAPLRQMLPTVRCRTEDVQHIDLRRACVEYEGYDGHTHTMDYDHVVIACGSVVNLGTVPGMADHAFPLKTVGDAIALRLHIMQQLEKAEVCDNPDLKRWYLTFVVVGGGYSGVEVAGEIQDLVQDTHRFFQNIVADESLVILVHSRDQILPEINPSLREFARAKMEKAGIHVVLQSRVAFATADGVRLQDGRMLRTATVVCTIGNATPPVVERLDAAKERGRLLTEADMRLPGTTNAWTVGDCAHIINTYNSQPSPPTGQFAERQGRQVAENIVCALHQQPTRPFRFRPLGQLCSIGGHSAVAEMFGLQVSGFPAWFLWRGVYLFKLPSWPRRVKVGFDWAWDLFFPRDLAHPKTDQTARVSSAHYQPGDYIIRQGDPGLNFYIVERGEVEVLRSADEDSLPENVAILGPGDFFGETALIDNRPRNASIRARTTVEILVLGRNIFAQLSDSMVLFRVLLADAMKRRNASFWQRLPAVHDVLVSQSLSTFLEPSPAYRLTLTQTFADALALFDTAAANFCCVVDEQDTLLGIVTRTDIFRAMEIGARRHTLVRDFMITDPVAMTIKDSSLLATATMREHGFKWLPVIDNHEQRRLMGYVRAERMLNVVLQHMPMEQEA